MIETNQQDKGHQDPIDRQLGISFLSVPVAFVVNYMGVFAIRPLEPVTTIVELSILSEIVLEHVDLCHILHQRNQSKVLILEVHR